MEKTEKTEKIVLISVNTIFILHKSKYLKFKQVKSIENFKNKASLLGIELEKIADDLYECYCDDCATIISEYEMHLDNSRYSGIFEGTEFETIDLTDLHCENTTDMSRLFYECKAKKIIFGNINTGSCTNMNYMFAHCEATEIDLRSFDTSNTTSMTSMFYECKANKLILGNFDINNKTRYDIAFLQSSFNKISSNSNRMLELIKNQ